MLQIYRIVGQNHHLKKNFEVLQYAKHVFSLVQNAPYLDKVLKKNFLVSKKFV